MKRRKRRYSKIAVLLSLSILATSIILPVSFASAAKIKLNKTKLKLTVGSTYKLKLSGKTGKIKWTSSKKKVASVNAKGVVKAKKTGKTTISAVMKGKKYKCKVTVKKAKQTKATATTKPATVASSKMPSVDTAIPTLLPSQTPFTPPTPIPTMTLGDPIATPEPTDTENPSITPAPTGTENPNVPLEPSELAKNISLQSELLDKNILITVTNHNAIWINEVTINYNFFDTEGNNIATNYATIPSMQPEETQYITVSIYDEIKAIDEVKSTLEIEATEPDSDVHYLDITEEVTLTEEQYDATLAFDLFNHSKYDADIAFAIFYYDAEQNVKDANSDIVSLNAKESTSAQIDLPLDESTGSPLYDHYQIVYSAHGTEFIDPESVPYIEKIVLTPQKTTHTLLIEVKNTNSVWLKSINLDYRLYDAEDNFLVSEELSLFSMKPGETQWVTITADPETIENIDLDQSYANITLEIDDGEYAYNTTNLVTSTIAKTEDTENDYIITITSKSPEDTEGSYVVYFKDANNKVISAQYDIYQLPARDYLELPISGPESYDENGNPVYAKRCEVEIYASHTLKSKE